MKTLRQLISSYMYRVTCAVVVVIIFILLIVQASTEQRRAGEDAARTITQIQSVLGDNQKELAEIKKEYKQTCLHNAETVARIIENDPDVLNSVEGLKEIAAMVEVDEIHVFDTTGTIVTGTHPEYYGLTLDSGEQIRFFKPMLTDKSLSLVQDIAPNTAEEKSMQYSAVWSENGEFIVQVGMDPVNVMKVTEKNELSYIFSLFRVNPAANYYAIDAESGEIIGSSDLDSVGLHASEAGFDLQDIENKTKGFHTKLNGKLYFCVFQKWDNTYIGRVLAGSYLYQRIPVTTFYILISLIIVAIFLAKAVVRYMNKYVVSGISDVNEKLQLIANGHLEEHVEIRSSAEFAELSNFVNFMVRSLLNNNKKMSYVLSKTNMCIGTYEYGGRRKGVYYTEYTPRILSLDGDEMAQFSTDAQVFAAFLDDIRQKPLQNEPGIFRHGEQYIRLEEIRNGEEVLGVVVDVTAEITKRLMVEKERDVDALTGLYNRRGLDTELTRLFKEKEKLAHSAIIMIDADGLKGINDTYGHEKGDLFLKRMAQTIADVGTRSSVAARLGGDEFVLFLYGYESEEELQRAISSLEHIQSGSFAALDENINVPLRFSLGYCMTDKENDYRKLLQEADQKMYRNKAERKSGIGVEG